MIFHYISPSHFERWSYKNPLEQGIGGSETAHIETCIRLAKRGHKIYSYSPLPKEIKRGEVYKGVEWWDLKDADFSRQGIWISGRWPQLADHFKKKKNQKLFLVMQDTYYPSLTKRRALRFDLLLPLCSTHLNTTIFNYPYMKEKIKLFSNGIRTDIINDLPIEERDPFRIIYASSPDRGLINLLKIFPKILQKEPKANLHIYYGLDNILKHMNDDESIDRQGTTPRQLKTLASQPSVFWHGRISQLELYSEYLKSGIWAYPTSFQETSCITSMEAQALGSIPVTNPLWALKDNVTYGSFIDGDPSYDGLTRLRYVDEIVFWMNYEDPTNLPKYMGDNFNREIMMIKVRERFNWERVIDQLENYAKY